MLPSLLRQREWGGKVGRPRREAAARQITIAEGQTKNHRNLFEWG